MSRNRDEKGRFVKGKSGNPGGRAKDDKSWAGIIRDVGNMTADEILEFIPKNNDLGRMIAKLPKSVQMKYLITARVMTSLMWEPTGGLWNALMDRAEGKVKSVVEHSGLISWREFIEDENNENPESDS